MNSDVQQHISYHSLSNHLRNNLQNKFYRLSNPYLLFRSVTRLLDISSRVLPMDSYYSSPSSYYYQPTCPVHDSSSSFLSDSSYIDPYSSYPPPSTSYYYPTYNDQTSSPILFYNNSTTNIYSPPTYSIPSTNIQRSSSNAPMNPTISTALNTTFESGRNVKSVDDLYRVFFFLAPPPGRRRRQRTIFSKDQVDILDQVFEKNQYPDIQLREQLSERLDVPEARIQVCLIPLLIIKIFLIFFFRIGLVQKSS